MTNKWQTKFTWEQYHTSDSTLMAFIKHNFNLDCSIKFSHFPRAFACMTALLLVTNCPIFLVLPEHITHDLLSIR